MGSAYGTQMVLGIALWIVMINFLFCYCTCIICEGINVLLKIIILILDI